jgi:hypothetical protein
MKFLAHSSSCFLLLLLSWLQKFSSAPVLKHPQSIIINDVDKSRESLKCGNFVDFLQVS